MLNVILKAFQSQNFKFYSSLLLTGCCFKCVKREKCSGLPSVITLDHLWMQ